jgi:hypothetical protein
LLPRLGRGPRGSGNLWFYVGDGGRELRNRFSIHDHAFEVQDDSLADIALDFLDRFSGGDASRQVRDIGGEVTVTPLDRSITTAYFFIASPSTQPGSECSSVYRDGDRRPGARES